MRCICPTIRFATHKLAHACTRHAHNAHTHTHTNTQLNNLDYTWEGGNALQATFRQLATLAFSPTFSTLYFIDTTFNAVFSVTIASNVLSRVMGVPWNSLNFGGFAAIPLMPPAPYAPPPYAPGVHSPFNITGGALNTWWGTNCPDPQPRKSSLFGMEVDKSTGDLVGTVIYEGVVWRLTPATGVVRIIAGTGLLGSSGDLGSPLSATFYYPMFVDFDGGGNIYVSSRGDNVIRVIFAPGGAPSSCPAGYVCQCGLSPIKCPSAQSYCPQGSSQPYISSPGYTSTSLVDATGSQVYVSQVLCPLGAYCAGGTQTLCQPGRYGVNQRQASATACMACPAGSYSASPGASFAPQLVGYPAAAAFPCRPCAQGFFPSAAPEGNAFCSACPPGTSSWGGPSSSPKSGGSLLTTPVNSSSTLSSGCFPCPLNAVAGYGAEVCTPLDPATATETDTQKLLAPTFAYQRSLTFSPGNMEESALTGLYIVTASLIVGFFTIPLAILGLLYGGLWTLGSWEAFLAPLPPGVKPRTWGAFGASLYASLLSKLPTLTKLPQPVAAAPAAAAAAADSVKAPPPPPLLQPFNRTLKPPLTRSLLLQLRTPPGPLCWPSSGSFAPP